LGLPEELINVDPAVKVSIIVTCRNNEETIGECLQALSDQDYPVEALEVIVVDACSTDKTVEIAKKFTDKVYCEPLNAAAAYNYAMKLTSFSVLGFVDSDAKVEKDWLKKIVPRLSESDVAGVSGAIETWNSENLWARSIGYEIKNRYSRLGKYTGRIATMNLLLKRKVMDEVGGWNEALPSQYDTDFGYRLSQKGYKIAYEPTAKCYHFNRPTLRAYWRQQIQYGKNTTRLYFMYRHLARGDEITDFGMNLQPPLMLAVIAIFIIGFVPLLRLAWMASGVVLAAVFVYYVYSAAKISVKFKDKTAMRLIVLYFVRTFAWFAGAAKFVFSSRRKPQ
jgi:cellulose synthase/poly-beta-1,6-N-acetylglucosamine synthase-like glycosyltransferase